MEELYYQSSPDIQVTGRGRKFEYLKTTNNTKHIHS
jgi:hypothetical protein